MTNLFPMTNATKGALLGVVNTVLALIVSFGVDLSADQIGTIMACVNAIFTALILVTYKNSPKRVSDDGGSA